MISEDMFKVYKRFFALGMLLACLALFDFSAEAVNILAPCMQDCESSSLMCQDSCAPLCSDTDDPTCNSCLSSCATQFQSCSRHAVWCSSGGSSYTPSCEVDYTVHCPVSNTGQVNCSDPASHWGYTLTCTTLGGNHCVACPDHGWQCTGSNGYGSCS